MAWFVASPTEGRIGARVHVASSAQPRVKVVGDQLLLYQAAPPVLESMGEGGFVVTELGESEKTRQKTEIFVGEAWSEAAAKLARLLGGDVAVKKLNWQENAEIVVALGTASLPARTKGADALFRSPDADHFSFALSAPKQPAPVLVGWTKDSRYLVFERTVSGCCGDPIGSYTATEVIDTALFEHACFLSKADADSSEALKPPYFHAASLRSRLEAELAKRTSECGDRRQLEDWLANHALDENIDRGRRSVDGRHQARIEVSHGEGQWSEDVFTWKPMMRETTDGKVLMGRPTLTVVDSHGQRGGKVDVPDATSLCVEPYAGNPAPCRIWLSWAPDQSRVVWVMQTLPSGMGSISNVRLYPGPTKGPRVRLAVHETFPPAALERLRVGLSESGYLPTVGKASKARKETVIYAAPGFEPAARELSGVVPGGAKVEPLTWKESVDVVIAVGTSAR